jgi:hypothetical protein
MKGVSDSSGPPGKDREKMRIRLLARWIPLTGPDRPGACNEFRFRGVTIQILRNPAPMGIDGG